MIELTEDNINHYVEGTKKNWTLIHNPGLVAVANARIIEEFLDAICGALDRQLNIACGDLKQLSEEECRLFNLYASWDSYGRGKRPTSKELIERNKDDTWDDV